jgi:hypothetical protein
MPSKCSPDALSSKALLSVFLFLALFEGAFPGALILARAGLAERTMAGGSLALGASGPSCRKIHIKLSAVCKPCFSTACHSRAGDPFTAGAGCCAAGCDPAAAAVEDCSAFRIIRASAGCLSTSLSEYSSTE